MAQENLQGSGKRGPLGTYQPLYPTELGRSLYHTEMDYNLDLIGQVIQGYRVMGTNADGSINPDNDTEKILKLYVVKLADTALINAGAEVGDIVWVPTDQIGDGNLIGELQDVNINNPTDSEILIYNGATSMWENTSDLTFPVNISANRYYKTGASVLYYLDLDGTSQVNHLKCFSNLSFGNFIVGIRGVILEGYSTHSVIRNDSDRLDFFMGNSTGGVGTTLSIQKNGNVGIGTTSPTQAKLVLSGDMAFNQGDESMGLITPVFEGLEFRVEDGVSPTTPLAMIIKGAVGGANIGVGTPTPGSKLTVANGDVEVEDISSGVILKSPNGTRYRITVADNGTLTTVAV